MIRGKVSWDGPVLLVNELPVDVFQELKNAKKGATHVEKLVGVFPDEYKLDTTKCPKFTKHCLNVSNRFLEKCGDQPVFRQIRDNTPWGTQLKIADFWRNEMYSGSYNPLHQHSGLLSFIIYLEVPYTIEHQIQTESYLEPRKVKHGFTEFIDPFSHYTRFFPVSPAMEGTMLLFPAWVKHVVYPFKNCDKPRVTIAGNIMLDYGDEGEEHF